MLDTYVTTRTPPRMQLVFKPKRNKYYRVIVTWEYESPYTNAMFLHPGDAYSYGCKLQDNFWTYAEDLLHIKIET